ncbi:MAG: respiratory nitrate reductase subunit gamma [Phenylobacterium sp.]|uniref:respiratory nitrate reductase subunit gamma n=1 Tax=Phenylobacterium sp. TaxID=1871053 RepID=UPI001A5DC93E|nr:respiratory nitrate reductase subunit gamma [Phenylobacterium sp.]MBL8556206.1 respiratory nitrate reductase subunit gamma [Phenylobacterium sp.]
MDLNQLLFGVYPYIALAVLAVGSVVRFDREPYTWRTGSSQLLRRRQLMTGSVLFHLGVLMIFAGHFVGLLTPIWIWDALGVPHAAKQMLAMVAGGVAGLFALVGGSLLLHRRLFDPRIRANSSFGDTAILVLLMLQLLLGLSTIPVSFQHRDGAEMLKFMNWAQGVFLFRPHVADFVADTQFVFKAHLTLGMTILLVFPFTRLVHMLSAPVWYLNRRGWQLVRTRRTLPRRPAALAPTYATIPAARPAPVTREEAAK